MSFLAVALAILAAALLYQVERAAVLEHTVGEMQQELVAARRELGASQRRMELVRTHVDDLSARVGALRGLVADDERPPH